MKKALGKYLFEFVVIFIGITASFLFEEWREHREKNEKAIEIMESLIVELERNDLFIHSIDTSYLEVDSAIQRMLDGDPTDRAEVAEVMYMLMEGTSQFRLKDISSFIHGFSSIDQLNILNRNEHIQRYLTYMESLISEHEGITNSINNYSTRNLWPLLNRYGLTDDILANQKDLMDRDSILLAELRIPLSELFSDSDAVLHLKWSQLKILRLIQINEAIHRQIQNIIHELRKAIDPESSSG